MVKSTEDHMQQDAVKVESTQQQYFYSHSQVYSQRLSDLLYSWFIAKRDYSTSWIIPRMSSDKMANSRMSSDKMCLIQESLMTLCQIPECVMTNSRMSNWVLIF